ncbi:MAG TPA: DUF937 domain-containing protein [Candidatus Limnocylindria bacterium]
MAELSDSLTQLLEGQTGQISQRIGADETQTRTAVNAAVPALLAALSQDAERGSGLQEAIRRDHDGAILDQLSEYLGGNAQLSPRTTNGSGILEHTLGARQPDMEQALSAKSGLDLGTIARLLPILAPIVMGMLGKKSQGSGGGGPGGFSFDDIGDLLNREKQDARARDPGIGDILDQFAKGGSRSGGGIGDALDGFLGKDRKG